jgi:D-alanyl-D-alanine carboxypeptidase/D-alanyl-D-alanine-endopeptidase (penicillin-binding protein 4)
MVNRLINKLGFRPSDYYIADGSGLSLYNYVSPELEVAFLRYAYANEDIYQHLIDAMPIAGVDGTLEKRMRSGYAHTNVKAKTGTVTGVSALTGYCTAANGHQLCFSIINMGIRKAAIGRNFQDHFCEALCMP